VCSVAWSVPAYRCSSHLPSSLSFPPCLDKLIRVGTLIAFADALCKWNPRLRGAASIHGRRTKRERTLRANCIHNGKHSTKPAVLRSRCDVVTRSTCTLLRRICPDVRERSMCRTVSVLVDASSAYPWANCENRAGKCRVTAWLSRNEHCSQGFGGRGRRRSTATGCRDYPCVCGRRGCEIGRGNGESTSVSSL
jgi:hypothetical protein